MLRRLCRALSMRPLLFMTFMTLLPSPFPSASYLSLIHTSYLITSDFLTERLHICHVQSCLRFRLNTVYLHRFTQYQQDIFQGAFFVLVSAGGRVLIGARAVRDQIVFVGDPYRVNTKLVRSRCVGIAP